MIPVWQVQTWHASPQTLLVCCELVRIADKMVPLLFMRTIEVRTIEVRTIKVQTIEVRTIKVRNIEVRTIEVRT
jgi:hypothetical protein